MCADARPAVYVHTSMPDSTVKTTGSWVIANLLWQKVKGPCSPLLLDLRVWNEDEEITGVSEVNGLFLNLHQEKDGYAQAHAQKMIK